MMKIAGDEISNLTIDHHGIVIGICRELKIAEMIDAKIGVHDGRKITPGQAVVAMIVNGLGFTNRRLYLSHQFFSNKPTELYFGEGIFPDDITEYTLGHALDEIYNYGASKMFGEIGFTVALNNDMLGKNMHVDTTSLAVNGQYENNNPAEEVHITHGYSKDMRADLKQVVLSLVVNGAANLPLWMEALNGNNSDKTSLHATIQKVKAFQQQINLEKNFKWVADSALYSENQLLDSEYLWLTRVPENITEAKKLVNLHENKIDWKQYDDNYKMAEYKSKYGNVEQRWLLIFSEQARKRENKTLSHLGNKEFNCAKDAEREINKISKQFKFHTLNYTVLPILKYDKRGRPSVDSVKQIVGYKITATHIRNTKAIDEVQESHGRFILATNDLDPNYSSSEMLKEYKEQQCVEGGFRFIKDPWFMVDSIFLKSAKRIEALMMVMTTCLLVYNFAQHKIRKNLCDNNDTLPNQLNKQIQTPTLRWIFQMMEGIGLIIDKKSNKYKGIITGLTALRKKILYYCGEHVCSVYGLIHKNMLIGLGM